jgi:uncharacterized protein YcgL (UPF0745 family)
MKIICQVYRSPRQEEMYLYVEKLKGLQDVPEPLLARFGEPEELMVLVLSAGKKLARANVVEVLEKIAEEGFYLQMPPTHSQLLRRDGNEH